MKNLKIYTPQIVISFLILFLVISCDTGTTVPFGTGDVGTGITKDFTTTSGGFLASPSGFTIEVDPGSILKNEKGENGTVTFSIEENIPLSELPAPIPAKFQLIGGVVSFGPNGFTFAQPITVWLPATNEPSPEDLYIIRYDEGNGWITVPISGINNAKKLLGVATFRLGYFALVRKSGSVVNIKNGSSIQGTTSEGGIKFCDFHSPADTKMRYGDWYIITIKSMTFKYPDQAEMWKDAAGNNTLLCADARTCSDPTSTFPNHPTIFRLPQGTYTFWVTAYSYSVGAQYHSGYFSYQKSITVTINGPLVYYGWGSIEDNSWTQFCDLLRDVDWTYSSSQPTYNVAGLSCWPTGTVPYGTGYFKTTLKWYNPSSGGSDLDLHLFGPNNMEVHFGDDRSANGELELDRDWMSESGDAVENIYSLKEMPKGAYTVKVQLFSGPAKSFTVDVKRGSYFKSYRKSVSTSKEWVTIESFNIN